MDNGTDANCLVSLRAAEVRFGGDAVLRNIDLEIQTGSFVTLVGPNGAGKTTCARLAGGLEKPFSGTVWRRPGLHVGYVPQHLNIPDSLPLTVNRFVAMRPGVSADAIRAALAEVGATPLVRRSMRSLSGGERQRAVLARALLGGPDLLILDEPTQGLDAAGCDDLFRLILRLRRERGCAVLMVSHDLHVVSAYSDHVVCLNRHICCQGAPESVDAHPEYRRLLSGRLRESHAVYVHHHDHAHGMGGQVADPNGAEANRGA